MPLNKCFTAFFFLLIDCVSLSAGTKEDFFEAVRIKDEQAIDRLMRTGMNIDVSDSSGKTPLIYAVELHHNEICRLLIDSYSADINRPDNNGNTPLMTAALFDNREIALYLLYLGADFNKLNKNKESALSIAINKGHFQLADNLIKHGAILFKEKIDYPFIEEIFTWKIRIMEGIRVLDRDPDNQTLLEAVGRGDYVLVREMLREGADPNRSDSMGLSPLMAAAALPEAHIFKLLIKSGADPRQKDDLNLDALLYASFFNRRKQVEIYLNETEPESNPDSLYKNPLFHAYLGDSRDVFEFLMKNGFSPESADARGRNLLHYAALTGSTFYFNLIAEYDPGLKNSTDSDGRDPLFYCLTGFSLTGNDPRYYPLAETLSGGTKEGRRYINMTDDPEMLNILMGLD